jgi:DNA-binding CsgD family transcriptional regulator
VRRVGGDLLGELRRQPAHGVVANLAEQLGLAALREDLRALFASVEPPGCPVLVVVAAQVIHPGLLNAIAPLGHVACIDGIEHVLRAFVGALTSRARAEDGASALLGMSTPPLTARELEVALLALEGWSHKQIASRLFLSARTVETHLSRVLTKCGLRGANIRALKERLRQAGGPVKNTG